MVCELLQHVHLLLLDMLLLLQWRQRDRRVEHGTSQDALGTEPVLITS